MLQPKPLAKYSSLAESLNNLDRDRRTALDLARHGDYVMALRIFRNTFFGVRIVPRCWDPHKEFFQELWQTIEQHVRVTARTFFTIMRTEVIITAGHEKDDPKIWRGSLHESMELAGDDFQDLCNMLYSLGECSMLVAHMTRPENDITEADLNWIEEALNTVRKNLAQQ